MHLTVLKTGRKIHPFFRLCRSVCKYFVMAHRIRILPSIAEYVVFCGPNRRQPEVPTPIRGGSLIISLIKRNTNNKTLGLATLRLKSWLLGHVRKPMFGDIRQVHFLLGDISGCADLGQVTLVCPKQGHKGTASCEARGDRPKDVRRQRRGSWR